MSSYQILKERLMADMSREDKIKTAEALFVWLNHISNSGDPMTLEDIKRLFTVDAQMVFNGNYICKGYEGMLLHSKDICDKMKKWKFNIPFKRVVVEGNTVFGYYTVDLIGKDGMAGQAHDMCIFEVKDGKIADICEVVHFAGHEVDVDAFE